MQTNEKITKINDWNKNNKYLFDKSLEEQREQLIDKIYNFIFIDQTYNEDELNDCELGILYHHIAKFYKEKNDFENAEKYYLIAIENGNANAINNLAYLYKTQKDYVNALKYFFWVLMMVIQNQ